MLTMFSLTLASLLMGINSSLSTKKMSSREFPSAFECGFNPKNTKRLPFSLQFYMISVIFLIFDVEITLILPAPLLSQQVQYPYFVMLMTVIIMILIMGLLYEWTQKSLEWTT